MTDIQVAWEGARLGAALAVFTAVYAGPFRAARAANWRQDLFAVRNLLWDRMRECGQLDAPAHRQLRETINTLIRYAPVMNLFYLAAALRSPPRLASGGVQVPPVDPGERRAALALQEARAAVVTLFTRQLFVNSLPGAFIGVPVLALSRVFRAASWATRLRAFAWGRMNRYAHEFIRRAAYSPAPVGALRTVSARLA